MAEARISQVHRQSIPSSRQYFIQKSAPPAKAVVTAVFLCPSHLPYELLPESLNSKQTPWPQLQKSPTALVPFPGTTAQFLFGSLLPRSKIPFFFFFLISPSFMFICVPGFSVNFCIFGMCLYQVCLQRVACVCACIWREGGIGRHNYWMILRKYFYPSTEFSFSQQN